jgi:hypothetical protein
MADNGSVSIHGRAFENCLTVNIQPNPLSSGDILYIAEIYMRHVTDVILCTNRSIVRVTLMMVQTAGAAQQSLMKRLAKGK